MSIPDLLEIPHVHLDHTSRIIYYNVLLHGILMDSDDYPGKEDIIAGLYHTCIGLTEGWLGQIKNTPADLYAALVMVSMSFDSILIREKLTLPFRSRCRLKGATSNSLGRHFVMLARLLMRWDISPSTRIGKGQVLKTQ